eukprot:TRINITY_DN6915_c0_g1_i1.p1 TRINITY_DN6915_c0_g1~~TRINITY_DN6915_c0_g1_i1.p1  ORF type:complete len:135 (-),score=16.82 TRINITY_DN6915_c0_g1_i1:127-531(-)
MDLEKNQRLKVLQFRKECSEGGTGIRSEDRVEFNQLLESTQTKASIFYGVSLFSFIGYALIGKPKFLSAERTPSSVKRYLKLFSFMLIPPTIISLVGTGFINQGDYNHMMRIVNKYRHYQNRFIPKEEEAPFLQ